MSNPWLKNIAGTKGVNTPSIALRVLQLPPPFMLLIKEFSIVMIGLLNSVQRYKKNQYERHFFLVNPPFLKNFSLSRIYLRISSAAIIRLPSLITDSRRPVVIYTRIVASLVPSIEAASATVKKLLFFISIVNY